MIYLDHNATSPVAPEVVDAMLPWLRAASNPASAHQQGQRARAAVEAARHAVAALVGGSAPGVVFTSGATEANHLFVRGVAARSEGPKAAAISAIEHPSVHGAAAVLAAAGWRVDLLSVGASGVVDLADVAADVELISVMAANHETGAIQPTPRGTAAVHVDASQAAGRIPLALGQVDGVSLSAHKLGGPPGVGALVLRSGEPFPAQLVGGGQERGRRAGTVPVALVVGFAVAARRALAELDARSATMAACSARIAAGVVALGGRVVAAQSPRLPNTTTAVFAGIRGDTLVAALDVRGVCASSGAACASGSQGPSPVLAAMGDPEPRGALRLSVGPDTSLDEVERALVILADVLRGARLAAALEG